jgi:hypothetical protein
VRHRTNELSFERPDWLFDRTYHLFTVAPEGPSPFSVVISKLPIEDETLEEMVDRIVHDLQHSLDAFTLNLRKSDKVAGEDAVILQFEWTQEGRQLFQRQAALIREGPSGRLLHQVAATATSDARPRHVAGFTELLATLRFRDADDPSD